ncbi:snaclec rhodocytin subunit alpha-like [Amia ocellicauda]|uniref:snaclec rhodocytin subunit alpha-like n=1 Tax=Amia ocellicauda TaxID=2972642 RepID=UPI00346473FF
MGLCMSAFIYCLAQAYYSLKLFSYIPSDIKNITLVKLNKTWEEALDYCRSHHTDLISSTSAVDQYLILKEAEGAQSSYVWLGLRLSLISGSWFWVNREPMVYNNGMQGGHDKCPDSNYCGAMSTEDGIWTNSSCGERMNFICYTDLPRGSP